MGLAAESHANGKDVMAEKDKKAEEKNGKDYTPPKGSTQVGRLELQGGRSIDYAAHADWIVLRKKEKPAAEIFHVAYLKSGEKAEQRPLTFVFNGGPGAASAYLHMGALGPKRALFNADGTAPAPPARLIDNPETWLAFTDLVFVDPVGTGFSRTVSGKDAEGDKAAAARDDKEEKREDTEFYGVRRDLESLGEFMQRCLSLYHRWESPLFVAGESYGGFRAARLAKLAQQGYGIGLNGAVIISPALEFTLLDSSDYDVLPWVTVFPTMAGAAAYHGRSKTAGADADPKEVLREAESFAVTDLARLLAAGSLMGDSERERIYRRAARFLGLAPEFVRRREGRISPPAFARALLGDARKVLGLYDATVTVTDPYPDRDSFEGPDPTLYGLERVFTAAINAHLRSTLGVDTEREYHLLSMEVNRAWKIDVERHALETQMGATDDLRYGMVLNPHMKVFLTHGIYDMVTPYFAASRIAAHMKLEEQGASNMVLRNFDGGHMFYLWDASRRGFRDAMEAFYRDAVP